MINIFADESDFSRYSCGWGRRTAMEMNIIWKSHDILYFQFKNGHFLAPLFVGWLADKYHFSSVFLEFDFKPYEICFKFEWWIVFIFFQTSFDVGFFYGISIYEITLAFSDETKWKCAVQFFLYPHLQNSYGAKKKKTNTIYIERKMVNFSSLRF